MNIVVLILVIVLIFHIGIEDVLEEIKSWFHKD